jgi:hypothetical protein
MIVDLREEQQEIDAGGGGQAEPAVEDKPVYDFETETEEDASPEDSTGPKAGEPGKADDGELEYSEGFLNKVKGKEKEDLLKMIYEGDKTISSLNQKLADNKKTTPVEAKKAAEVAAEKEKLGKQREQLQAELSELDEYIDKDERVQLQNKLSKLDKQLGTVSKEYEDLLIEEKVAERYNQDFNREIFEQNRKGLQEQLGLTFEDEAWKSIMSKSMEINDGGKLRQESFDAALLLNLGSEKYKKVLTAQGEANFRENLANARGKQVNILGSGKENVVEFNKLSESEQAKAIQKMTPDQFRKYYHKQYGRYPEN